jgi:hypothetical protein
VFEQEKAFCKMNQDMLRKKYPGKPGPRPAGAGMRPNKKDGRAAIFPIPQWSA